MRIRSMALVGAALAAAVGLSACGGSDDGSSGASNKATTSLTVYSSLPLQGAARAQSEAIVDGEKLALQEAGARVGGFTIKYVLLDDSTGDAGRWVPQQTSANARKAAQDKSTIAYLGDADSGATMISLPITNEAGILQVSPASTYVGLTRAEGGGKGEPDKYYPSGKRTFGRVVPADHIQAAAQVAYQKEEGCTKTFLVDDGGPYGRGLAQLFSDTADAQGLDVTDEESVDTEKTDFGDASGKLRDAGADCIFYAGTSDNNAVQLWNALHAAAPRAKIFGSDGVADSTFTGALPPAIQRLTRITSPTLDPKLYPPAAQELFRTYQRRFGKAAEPYAVYGYEAMKVVLLAIRNAGAKGNDKTSVINEFFKIKNRDSVLGKYSIDENGDTTLSEYGGDRVRNGQLVFDKLLKVRQG